MAIADILIRELEKYAGKAFNGYSYLTTSRDQSHFVITSIGQVRGERIVNTALVVQFIGDTIIIDRDIYDKQLVDALLQAGIPREKLFLPTLVNLCRKRWRFRCLNAYRFRKRCWCWKLPLWAFFSLKRCAT